VNDDVFDSDSLQQDERVCALDVNSASARVFIFYDEREELHWISVRWPSSDGREFQILGTGRDSSAIGVVLTAARSVRSE